MANEMIQAYQLSGLHLDSEISFDWVFPNSFVRARLSGIVREIHHDGCGVHLQLCNPDRSNGDKTEFTIERETTIVLGSLK